MKRNKKQIINNILILGFVLLSGVFMYILKQNNLKNETKKINTFQSSTIINSTPKTIKTIK